MPKKPSGRPEQFPIKKVIGFDQLLLSAIDDWRSALRPMPNSSEAIRQLLTEALREKGYLRPTGKAEGEE